MTKKYTAHVMALVLLAATAAVFFPGTPCVASGPYTLDLAWYRMDGNALRRLPEPVAANFVDAGQPVLLLAVTATPTEKGLYLYASKSQARGKVTEISAGVAGGAPILAHVIFPKGAEKPDPLRPGKITRGYEGPVTMAVPVPWRDIAGRKLDLEFSGLACSDMNCTPLILEASTVIPGLDEAQTLPDAAATAWWDSLRTGVAETMPAFAGGKMGQETVVPPRIPLSPGAISGSGSGVPIASFSLEKIVPVPFAPGLEVASLGKAVILGFFAGIILNLMPCVLPVLGIKLGALLQHAATPGGLRLFRRHQIFFALGILTWFTILAGLFHWLGLAWGQIFQSPAVVIVVAVALLLLALNLFGALSLPLIDFRAGNPKNPDAQAFMSGFAATLLATPCGGPLLGGVLSWALTQPLGVMALALESVGLGMAFPYLLLAAFPALAAKLPRPGSWMGVMEHVLGFLLLATVAYVVSFLPADLVARAVAALVLAGFGGWLWGLGGKIGVEFMRGSGRPDFIRTGIRLCAVLCVALALSWSLAPRSRNVAWQEYTLASFAAEAGKRLVLVDFTADWCPTCKVVEATALKDATVQAWRKKYDLALFKADLTRSNPEGEALLRAVGSVSIPVVAVFGTGGDEHKPLVLRDIVTAGQIETALARMARK